jgi:hypothetical protein
MKARRKSDGKIIEVEEAVYNMKTEEPCHKCLSDGHHYPASDLDFNVDAEKTVIQGWAARDDNGKLYIYSDKPERYNKGRRWVQGYAFLPLSSDLFPDLTWESEPEPVEIIIKRKKNG